jgi:hypothetical protein
MGPWGDGTLTWNPRSDGVLDSDMPARPPALGVEWLNCFNEHYRLCVVIAGTRREASTMHY